MVPKLAKSLMLSFAALTATVAAAPDPTPAGDRSWDIVEKALGQSGKDLPGGVRRFGWPRRDVRVTVGGVAVEPALALGSWAAFASAGAAGAMAMGDLVLTENEVMPVVRALQDGGVDVLAIHNHLSGETPRILYVHFHGHGDPGAIAKGLRAALDATSTPLAPPPISPPSAAPAERAVLDRVQEVLGRTGTLAGRVLQVSVARTEKIVESGLEIPPAMGMATALNFQSNGSGVAATGDFVLTADEVNPVVRTLTTRGISVTALHSHMLRETPRLFFLHFWAVGSAEDVAGGLAAALEKTAVRR